MHLLEREDLLDVLDDRADRALAGHGSVVLVAGEAGVGKTVLLRAFAARDRQSGAMTTPRVHRKTVRAWLNRCIRHGPS